MAVTNCYFTTASKHPRKYLVMPSQPLITPLQFLNAHVHDHDAAFIKVGYNSMTTAFHPVTSVFFPKPDERKKTEREVDKEVCVCECVSVRV